MTEKRNADYSASAVGLGEHASVKIELDAYIAFKDDEERLRGVVESMPEFKAWVEAGTKANNQKTKVQMEIDGYGSYQDIESGHYAVKQRRLSVSYLPEKVKQFTPDFAKAVIEEVVNKTKVEGLIKGGLITKEQVDLISDKSETFAYIIK
jgi:hypothetical protein